MGDLLPTRNRLLAALRAADPAAEAQLRVGLESIELELHAKVMGPDRPIGHVYFPETGVLSQIQQMRNGSAVEINLVGSDGMAGLAVYLGSVTFPMEVACSAPGTFLRMRSADFLAEVPGISRCSRSCTGTPKPYWRFARRRSAAIGSTPWRLGPLVGCWRWTTVWRKTSSR